jgi:hypothetical protein
MNKNMAEYIFIKGLRDTDGKKITRNTVRVQQQNKKLPSRWGRQFFIYLISSIIFQTSAGRYWSTDNNIFFKAF